MKDSEDDLIEAIREKLQESEKLLLTAEKLAHIAGHRRLYSKIQAEFKFLNRLLKSPNLIKDEHLRSTNLAHLSAMLSCIIESDHVTEILKPVAWNENSGRSNQLLVDVVADYGKTWIKIVARNPQALLHSSLGEGSYGKRTLLQQASELVQCAEFHPYLYETPRVKIWFAAGVTSPLVQALLKLNVQSVGREVQADKSLPVSSNSDYESESEDDEENLSPHLQERFLNKSENIPGPAKGIPFKPRLRRKNKIVLTLEEVPKKATLNLDVSTMICYVSSLTNGRSQLVFQEKILNEQAERERICPAKPILDQLFEGRELVCCQRAFTDFQEILSVVAGVGERIRSAELFARIQIIPDQLSKQALDLNVSSKVKSRSRVVFGTGDAHQAVTVTANQAFLRAAEAQGYSFVSFLHESRALTEMKEINATPLPDN